MKSVVAGALLGGLLFLVIGLCFVWANQETVEVENPDHSSYEMLLAADAPEPGDPPKLPRGEPRPWMPVPKPIPPTCPGPGCPV